MLFPIHVLGEITSEGNFRYQFCVFDMLQLNTSVESHEMGLIMHTQNIGEVGNLSFITPLPCVSSRGNTIGSHLLVCVSFSALTTESVDLQIQYLVSIHYI